MQRIMLKVSLCCLKTLKLSCYDIFQIILTSSHVTWEQKRSARGHDIPLSEAIFVSSTWTLHFKCFSPIFFFFVMRLWERHQAAQSHFKRKQNLMTNHRRPSIMISKMSTMLKKRKAISIRNIPAAGASRQLATTTHPSKTKESNTKDIGMTSDTNCELVYLVHH